MSNTEKKNKQGLTRKQEQAASLRFGHHVSPRKALIAVLGTTLCCALPMLLGLRLWAQIPALVETGLIGPGGVDDSMPRPMLVFAVPGLGCVLNLITHGQLWVHQKAMKVPPTPVRVLGRWTIAPISLILSSLGILRAAGEQMDARFLLPCVLGLLLLLLGGRFLDLPRDSRWGFRLEKIRYSQTGWDRTHLTAGICWMAAGLLVIGLQMALGSLPWVSAPIVGLLLLAPLAAAMEN